MLLVHWTKQRWCVLMRKVTIFTVLSLVALQATFIFNTLVLKLTMKCWDATWMIARLFVVTCCICYMFMSVSMFLFCYFFTILLKFLFKEKHIFNQNFMMYRWFLCDRSSVLWFLYLLKKHYHFLFMVPICCHCR